MSSLHVNTLEGPTGVNEIRMKSPSILYAPGHIVQVRHNTVFTRVYMNPPNNDGGMRGDNQAGDVYDGGLIIRPMDISIRPSSPRSCIYVEFCMFYEAGHDTVFSILRDFSLVGAQYQMTDLNAARWVGAGGARYDNNNDSTPSYICLPWFDFPGTTEQVTYSIAAKSSNSSSQTLILNGTFANYPNGADAHEIGTSFSIAQEIAR
jgi:hypothetical protein